MQYQINEDEHWTTYAACSGVDDPELFYPINYTGPAVFLVTEAKMVCGRCIVRDECLAWALRAGEPEGIWGGTTPEERRHLRRRVPA
ncbi:MAG: transcription factor WhiB [Actinomycetia bacterium]|nr:transcription factor WhiB [Actinomycetes bacterium]